MAEDIDQQLIQMSETLSDAIDTLNKSSERNLDPRNPVDILFATPLLSFICF